GGVLVGPDDGGVDHRVLVVWVNDQLVEDDLPDTGVGPAQVAAVDVLPAAEAGGQIAPGNAGAVAVQDRVDEQAVVASGASAGVFASGDEAADGVPLSVGEGVSAGRDGGARCGVLGVSSGHEREQLQR